MRVKPDRSAHAADGFARGRSPRTFSASRTSLREDLRKSRYGSSSSRGEPRNPTRHKRASCATLGAMLRELGIFAASAILTALGFRLAATAPFWDWVIGIGFVVMLLSIIDFSYVQVIRPRLKGHTDLDPLLVVAMSATLIAFGALGIYAYRSPQGAIAASGVSSGADGQPELILLPPRDRYTFKWDPTVGMYFDIQRDSITLPSGQFANPGFVLHNTSKVAAADVLVSWHAEISEIKELTKIGRLARYDIRFPDDYTMDLVSSNPTPVPNFRYYPNSSFEQKIAFVARDSDLFLPMSILPILGIFIVAKMPEELGDKTAWFPIKIEVSWNVPDGGQPQQFEVKIRAVNTKPGGILGPPEVVGNLDFQISKR